MKKNINLDKLYLVQHKLNTEDTRTFNDLLLWMLTMYVDEKDFEWCVDTTIVALKKGRGEKNENS